MARVSICDWCKRVSKEDFTSFLDLIQEDESTKNYEVCKECNESLRAQLEGDDSLTTPRAATSTPSVRQARGDSVPTPELLEHESAVVPSRVDLVGKDDGCNHKFEFTTEDPVDPHMGCGKCGARLDSESFD